MTKQTGADSYLPEFKIKNAVIESARITGEDHNLLDVWLTLNYGGSGQDFGGWALYLPKSFTHHKGAPHYAGHFIWRVMEVAGVLRWDQVVGKTIRARASHSKVDGIGHIIKDDWFFPSKDFEQLKADLKTLDPT